MTQKYNKSNKMPMSLHFYRLICFGWSSEECSERDCSRNNKYQLLISKTKMIEQYSERNDARV